MPTDAAVHDSIRRLVGEEHTLRAEHAERVGAPAAQVQRLQELEVELDQCWDLADLLHETAEHHDSYEKVAPPHDWWDWYAAYLHARQNRSTPNEASEAAGRHMAEAKHVVVPPA